METCKDVHKKSWHFVSNALLLRVSARVSWKINMTPITKFLIKIVCSHEYVLLFYRFLESYSVTKLVDFSIELEPHYYEEIKTYLPEMHSTKKSVIGASVAFMNRK